MRRRLLPALLLATLLGGIWILFDRENPGNASFVPSAPAVRAARVETREIEERIEALGTTLAWESIEVRPTVTAFIEQIHFSDGQLVKAGELLVTLSQDEEAARLAEARAFLDEQLREVRRIEGLVANKSISRNQLDERRTLAEIARQRVAVAEAALADRSIRAAFSGVVGLRRASPGALASPETVITTLDDVAALRLDFSVSSMLLERLRAGSVVRAASPAFGARQFDGEVIGIDTRVNPVDRSLTVRARIDNSDLLLKPGMLMTVELQHDRRVAMVIPEEAVIHYQRQHYVMWIDTADGNRLERRRIAIGHRMPGSVEVVSGLAEGDLVVAEGLTTTRAGQQVELLASQGGSTP
jgi:membrane fusion protein, multidrug efflux system